jgi:hypothetical protein
MDYPKGVGDCFEYCARKDDSAPKWEMIEISGSWFPEAFIGSMAEVQRHKESGGAQPMATSVEDVIKTMACLEAAYESDSRGGVKPETYL